MLLIAMSIGREFDPKSENEFPIITIFQEKKVSQLMALVFVASGVKRCTPFHTENIFNRHLCFKCFRVHPHGLEKYT